MSEPTNNEIKRILSQAKAGGFICQQTNFGTLHIYHPTRRWELYQQEERWILIVRDVPQISLTVSEVEVFLKRETYKSERSDNRSA